MDSNWDMYHVYIYICIQYLDLLTLHVHALSQKGTNLWRLDGKTPVSLNNDFCAQKESAKEP